MNEMEMMQRDELLRRDVDGTRVIRRTEPCGAVNAYQTCARIHLRGVSFCLEHDKGIPDDASTQCPILG